MVRRVALAGALLLNAMVVACARMLGHEWTEGVALSASSDESQIAAETPNAVISCALRDLLTYSQDPTPLTPHQRAHAESDAEGWARSWAEYAGTVSREFQNRGAYVPMRADELKDQLHAGLCSVVDRRSGSAQQRIIVVVHDNPERRGGGGGRSFRFADGEPFLSVVDWMY
jgi:hypothetical protein